MTVSRLVNEMDSQEITFWQAELTLREEERVRAEQLAARS